MILVGIVAAGLSFLGTLQIRSQVQVAQSLATQDNTALAFLIDDLHRANDSLSSEQTNLTQQADTLQNGNTQGADAQLNDEITRLRLVEGLISAQGPGVTVTVTAPLVAVDLQDAVNNLRVGGAEVIQVNQYRVVASTVIAQQGPTVTIDGYPAASPWTFKAIGDPVLLTTTAQEITRSLEADSRVQAAGYQPGTNLTISAVVSEKPIVYGRS
jgi:uncharacterized protein YlxW (UPF0749 family)